MQKTIRDTYIYKVLDLESTIKNCGSVNSNIDKYTLKQEILDAILNDFKFKISFPAKVRVIEEIKSGRITLVDTEMVTALPTWMVSDDGIRIKTAIVNLFGKIKVKDDGTAQFNSREIFSLVIIALTVKDFYQNEAKVLNNLQISKLAVIIYDRIMYRVLDTLYSLDIGPLHVRELVHVALRFFMLSFLMEKKFVSANNYDNLYNYVLSDLTKDPQKVISNSIVAMDEYKDFPTFISNLSIINPILKDLDIAAFLRKFIMMYGEKALLMIENYQYFLAYIFSVTLNGNIIKDFALETPIGKEGILLYNAYFDLMK
jgi:hypothetical protein